MAGLIAGHTFVDTVNGRICVAERYNSETSAFIPCHRKWVDIMGATMADVGAKGIAHLGLLNAEEVKQIQAEREAEQSRVWDAVTGISSARGR